CLSVFTNGNGGIQDDLVVSKTDKGYLYVVSNAGCIDKDVAHMKKHESEWKAKGKDVQVKVLNDYGLIALQGPEALLLLETETDIDLTKLYFMHTAVGTVAGVSDCRVTRCGYTGEDGFEIKFPISSGDTVPKKLMESKRISTRLAGLGA
ncbi:UNVERIFIED_CONTAM: Aminomethyltransferase, mitochondrial, partial [Eudyptes robustus]